MARPTVVADAKYGTINLGQSGPVPADAQPAFLLLAQDELAIDTLKYYMRKAKEAGSPQVFVERVEMDVLQAFEQWRKDHKDEVHVPD